LVEAGDVIVFRLRAGTVAKHAAIVTGASAMVHAIGRARLRGRADGLVASPIAGAFQFPSLSEGF
jgi:cell wall-associated NlpC family hydrolase